MGYISYNPNNASFTSEKKNEQTINLSQKTLASSNFFKIFTDFQFLRKTDSKAILSVSSITVADAFPCHSFDFLFSQIFPSDTTNQQ